MKKILLCLVGISFVFKSPGQIAVDESAAVIAIWGKDKQAVIADCITLDDSNRDKFWRVYDQYERATKAMWTKNIELMVKFASEYNSSGTTVNSKPVIKNDLKCDRLNRKYFRKFRRVTSPRTALQFIELYTSIQTTVLTYHLDRQTSHAAAIKNIEN